jgi:hypothetical protein
VFLEGGAPGGGAPGHSWWWSPWEPLLDDLDLVV